MKYTILSAFPQEGFHKNGEICAAFVKSSRVTSENGNFELSLNNRNNAETRGWYGGGWGAALTIRATKDNLKITRISAVVNSLGEYFGGVTVSKGTKLPNADVTNGETVHVTDINDSVFSFTGDGFCYSIFRDITVYYTVDESAPTASTLSEGNIWILCGVGAAAVIAVGAFVITRKKKNTAAEE